MSQDFIVVNSLIYQGLPKPAKLLREGEHILFGGRIWIVADANFNEDAKYPNDLDIQLYSLMANDHQTVDKIEQRIIVDRDFEIQPLVISVLPARTKEEETANAATAQG